MKTFLSIGWGVLGETVADSWRELNKRHFKNALEPGVPGATEQDY